MKSSKKIIAGFLAVITMMAGVLFLPTSADAVGTAVEVKSEIVYEGTKYATYADAWGMQDKVPTKTGYLFGGWYEDAAGTTAIKTKDQVTEGTDVFAKFVPSHVLSVKAQNYSTTKDTDSTTDKTNTRMVSSIDSRAYQNVGFDVIDIESGTVIASEPFNTVYSKLQVIEGETTKDYMPQDIFGTIDNAKEQKFIVLTVTDIPEAKWNSDVYVRPYWTTYDGVKVCGLGKYVYVRDGIDGWVSIPVNLHTGAQVAAGMVSVTIPTGEGYTLTYQECRAGRVFKEMTATQSDNVIKCVGNISELANVSANDLYAVLRFKVEGEYKVGNGTFMTFTINDLGFANISEDFVDVDIINVRY